MDLLEDKGLILSDTRQDLLNNSVVLIVPQNSDSEIDAFEDLTGESISKIAMGDPEFVPAGTYGKQAFELLGITADNLDDLLDDGTLTVEGLTEILLYHVAHGRRFAEDVLASEKIRMLNKSFVQQAGGVLTDNQGGMATIIVTDVPAARASRAGTARVAIRR